MGGVSGDGCQEISYKISRNRECVRGLQSDIAQRQNKNLIHGLHHNDPTIMPDSSVEYLRRYNSTL